MDIGSDHQPLLTSLHEGQPGVLCLLMEKHTITSGRVLNPKHLNLSKLWISSDKKYRGQNTLNHHSDAISKRQSMRKSAGHITQYL